MTQKENMNICLITAFKHLSMMSNLLVLSENDVSIQLIL